MKPVTALALFALLSAGVACEGEPPRTAANLGPAPNELEALPPPTPEPPATPPPAAAAPNPCPCVGSPVAAHADGGAPEVPPVVATEPTVTHGDITGTVTATPKTETRNVVVYLEDAPNDPDKIKTITVDNRMMTFTPYISVVSVGGKVAFANTDPFPHNVFSPDNGGFNLGMIPGHTARTRTMGKAGVHTLLCNVHPGMIGYVVVAPSPYFARANAAGKFTIKDVPLGTYKVSAWAPRNEIATDSVTVKEKEVTVNFDLKRK